MSTHGLLKPLVVRQLQSGPQSGYSLVKGIHEQTGWKPSFGSIYPLLERMQHERLVNVKAKGRSKLYSLTAEGKAFFAQQREQQGKAYDTIIEQMRVLGSLGDQEAASAIQVIQNVKEGDVPFKEIPESRLVRKEMMRLLREQKLKANQKKLRSLFTHMYEELKKL